MHQSLINHGCVPNKSLILKPPEINDELKLYWILGYFDGDGYISVYYSGGKYLRLQTGFTGTYEVLSFIKEYLGWNQSLRQEHRCTNNTYRLQATEKPSLDFLSKVYNDETVQFCLERKYNKYKEYLELKNAHSIK